MPAGGKPRLAAAGLVCVCVCLCVSLVAGSSTAAASGGASTPPVAPERPNIVFILTDDLSMNLLRFMPHVQSLEQQGLTFNDYFVSDSLCCPSRSSIFTGEYPHDTGVFSNTGKLGGFRVFHERGEERHTFAVALARAGYRTALMGKYLNGYLQKRGGDPDVPATFVPEGWSEWDVAGWGYPEFDYTLNENGTLHHYGHRPADYLTDVLARKGVQFIDSSAAAGKPFFLELATFAPHAPYVPAPRNAGDFPGLEAPRPPNFDVLPTHPPAWLAWRDPLTQTEIDTNDSVYRLRAQDVESVDQMIGSIEGALQAAGVAGDTYLVFSSDNGLHTGEYRLMPGKMTAFDTDIHVPLVIAGPGVRPGATTNAMAENVDLADTFSELGGTSLPGDGHSLLPLFGGGAPPDWRNTILVEHRGPVLRPDDPDFQQPASGNPTSYEAMRTADFLYVEYKDREREFYDLRADPFELHNVVSQLTAPQLAQLHAELLGLERCHGAQECWAATHVDTGPALARQIRHRL